MNGKITPDLLWQGRVDQLRQDLKRVEALLDDDLLKGEPGFEGRFRFRLSNLTVEAEDLTNRAKGVVPDAALWLDLASLTKKGRIVVEAQLELLGGVAISLGVSDEAGGFDAGFANQASDWLNEISAGLDLHPPLSVIAGRGPLLEPETAIVRMAFLDSDLWQLAQLGRALGLLATQPQNDKYLQLLDSAVEPILGQIANMLERDAGQSPPDLALMLPEVSKIWRGVQYVCGDAKTSFQHDNQARVKRAAESQRTYLHYLFADMFATAILGPCYVLAVFTLELDYGSPQLNELEDRDQIEGRETAPRFLPAPVHRAAAMLATLQAMDDKEAGRQGPYTEIIQRLKGLWQAAIRSAEQQDLLDEVCERFDAWYGVLYSQVIRKALKINLKVTQQTWENTQAWHKALAGKGSKPTASRPGLTEILGAIWLYRLDYPGQADNVLAVVDLLMQRGELHPRKGDSATLSTVIAQARLDGLRHRWDRLAEILRGNQLSQRDRAAVGGRFYRMISEQLYNLDQCQDGLEELAPQFWRKLAALRNGARLVQREALEFLGGLLVHKNRLDREPANLTGTGEAGPSVCDLADQMLRTYSRRTGVNWAGRTVLGKNPFLATDTDVIRIRFLDWSLWDLPLMAHEFGHLAALATPAFLNYQSRVSEQASEDHPNPDATAVSGYSQARRRQLDEFFADIFATYTAGPAFACAVIVVQLNPLEAYLWRGSHPSHHERVQVILQTLSRMNELTKRRVDDPGSYGTLLAQLEQGWNDAIHTCQAVVEDEKSYSFQLKQARKWGRKIYDLIDTYYRLGVSYTPERWRCAQELAKRLLLPGVPLIADIEKCFAEHSAEGLTLDDVLNALWIARVGPSMGDGQVTDLTKKAFTIGHSFLKER